MDFSAYNDFFKLIGLGHLNSLNYEMNYRPVDNYEGYAIQIELTCYTRPQDIDTSHIEKIKDIIQLYNSNKDFRAKVNEYLVMEKLK